jgi:hypothetical protein
MYRYTYFPQIHKEFENKPNIDKLPYLFGEILQCAIIAARFVACCQEKRVTMWSIYVLNIPNIYVYLYLLDIL